MFRSMGRFEFRAYKIISIRIFFLNELTSN